MSKPIKLNTRHVREQWNEGHPDKGGDGYWVVLKEGYKWAGDPAAPVHCIHEPTRAACYRESVMVCDCKDCAPAIAKQAKKRNAWLGQRWSARK